jgi:hypothetical protein
MAIRRTRIIYGAGALAASLFLLTRHLEDGASWPERFVVWILACGIPLLFVFAYPRYLFTPPAPPKRARHAAVLHGMGAAAASIAFSVLAKQGSTNPLYDWDAGIAGAVLGLSVLVLFLVVAVSLLLRNRSGLVVLAAGLFWPYWFLLALMSLGRFLSATPAGSASYFACWLSPLLFALAAGAISYRPAFAHAAALAGIVGAPWIYSSAIQDTGLGNAWLAFDLPDTYKVPAGAYETQSAVTIFAVALIALAVVTAGLRLLPAQWQWRATPMRDWTWPAGVVSLGCLAVWFSQSVLPYRIPGALDASDYPVFQILHVEKRGLQFHERCFNVYGHGPHFPLRISFTGSDRRLFQYRFQIDHRSLPMSQALAEHVQAFLALQSHEKRAYERVRPIWDWNADRWYVLGPGLQVYGAGKESTPPPEIVALFQELDSLPHSPETHSQLRDVCLGFCYDARSAMGQLYANHRCFNRGMSYVCE